MNTSLDSLANKRAMTSRSCSETARAQMDWQVDWHNFLRKSSLTSDLQAGISCQSTEAIEHARRMLLTRKASRCFLQHAVQAHLTG